MAKLSKNEEKVFERVVNEEIQWNQRKVVSKTERPVKVEQTVQISV